MNLSVNISDNLTPALAKLVQGFEATTGELLKGLADDIRDMTKDAMVPGVNRPANWAKLSTSYAKWKRQFYGNSDANLVLEGRLYDSITSTLNSSTESEVSTNVDYAAAHQLGLGHQKPRPYFPIINGRLTQRAEDMIYKRVDEWVTKQLS